MKKTALIALAATATIGAASQASAADILIGSYWVGGGVDWTTNPPVYTAQEAAALLFGGVASDYDISISDSVVTFTAWEDGWGDTSHLKTDWYQSTGSSAGTPVAQNYSLTLGSGYNDPFGGPAFSAYVSDHESAFTTASSPDASINYVFLHVSSAVPEPASWALMLGGFGLVGGALRRTRRLAISFG